MSTDGEPAQDASSVAEPASAADDRDDFRLLVNSLVDYAIIRLDPQGVVMTWSLGAERLKGYQSHEIVGQHFSLFYTPEDRAKGLPMAMLDDARANGKIARTGWRVRKDGQRFWGDVSITALRDDNGHLLGFAKVVRDLTERHEAEETLRRSEERLRLLIGSVIDYAIIGLDPQGIVETWNAGAQRIKGYFEDEIVGQHFSVFYGPEDRAAGLPLMMLDNAREQGHAEHSGWRVRKDGSRFWGDVVVTALRGGDGALVGFVKITRDLTERHAAEEAAREANESVARAAEELRLHQLRSDFMTSLSHDLRTPLTAIRGFAGLLRQGGVSEPEEQEEFTRQIEQGAKRLSTMVEDLLELAKLESGSVELQLRPTKLRAAAESVVASLQPILDTRRVELDISPSLVVQADPPSLDRIIVNLVSNAAKFTPADSTITLEARTEGADVFVSVADEGDGVSDPDKAIVFDRFRQGSETRQGHARGSGLGLSMVHDYVQLHAGRVWVEDAPSGGARFVFTLQGSTGDNDLA